MNFYKKNLEYLEGYHKYLYTKLVKKDDAPINNKLDDIKSVSTRDGDKAIIIQYKSNEYRLNSIYRPSEEAKRWASQYEFQNMNTTVAMFGFGNGVFARELISKLKEKDSLIIYEPCFEIFNHTLENYDITDILSKERVSLFVEGINERDFRSVMLSALGIANIKSQMQCIYPNYDKIFAESCIEFLKELKDSLKSEIININTTIKLAKRSVENIFNNFEFLPRSNSISHLAERFKNIPEDIPAIVVAAGPSVEKNIEYLKKAKGKAVIIAVDRILDYLLDNDIKPDFIVTLDPTKDVKYFSSRDDITIPLICYMEANNDILKKHKGEKIFCSTNPFIEELYIKANKTPPSLLPSGSVAIVAYTICVKLGFKRVILVVQDLAFDGEYSHAGGLHSNKSEAVNVFVEGIDGNPVKSRYDWKEFINRYQDLIAYNPDVEVIDAKEKGAKIKGAINMNLSEAVSKYCKKPFNLEDYFDVNEMIFQESDLDAIRNHLIENINVLNKIKEKSKKAIKNFDILLKEHKRGIITNKTDKALKNISKTNNFVEKQKIYTLMDPSVVAETAQQIAEISQISNDGDKEREFTYIKSKFIYESVLKVSDFVKERLEKAISKI
mgnify:CR=1 FL=1